MYDVGGFMQGIAALRLLEILDERIVALLRFRVVPAWKALEPFVARERELQGTTGRGLWRLFEEFAADAQALPDDVINTLVADANRARWGRLGFWDRRRRQLRRRLLRPHEPRV